MIKRVMNGLRARIRKVINEEIWLEDYVKLGMKIGQNCSIQPGVVFDYSHCWLISIGNHVTIAPQAYILAHDASTKRINHYTKIGSVTIEDHVFIGARALIMPGVTIGKNSIVAAGSVVTRSVPEGSVAAGNPAKVIFTAEEYERKIVQAAGRTKVYDRSYTLKEKIPHDRKMQMYEDLKEAVGFIE